MRERIDELASRRERIAQLGGPEAVLRQHEAGKLTARERLELLLDRGSFVEVGAHATHQSDHPAMAGRETPADGVVTGFGQIDSRPACVIAYDFTVVAGSMGRTGETKCARVREMALTRRVPLVWLIDSAGARIQEAAGDGWFAGSGYLFRDQVTLSGVVPLVAAMMGPGAAGTAYIPGLADFVPMVKGTSHMALGGPPLVKAVVGEDVDPEELGGSRVHTEISGVADLEVPDDRACLRAIRDYLSYFPSSNLTPPPVGPADDPVDRRDDGLLDVVPDSPRRAYDMHRVIERINIIFRKQIAAAGDPEAERRGLVDEFRRMVDPYVAASRAFIDDVIDPRQTRPVVIRALESARGKRVDRPWKKHGVMPV